MDRQTSSRRARPATGPTLWTAGLLASLAIFPGTCDDHADAADRITLKTTAADAYQARTPMPGDACTPLKATLQGATLGPGTYCFDTGALLSGVLTLQGPADGSWDFQVGTSGIGTLIAKGLTVVVSGGARACRVTWWVADGVVMDGSAFQGNVLAGGPISLTGGSYVGRTWSKEDVTVAGTAVTACAGTWLADWSPTPNCEQGPGVATGSCLAGTMVQRPAHKDNETRGGTGYAGRR